jgi:hypothetical protein
MRGRPALEQFFAAQLMEVLRSGRPLTEVDSEKFKGG